MNNIKLGTQIHFPSKLENDGWPEASAALDEVRAALGKGAFVRFDALWHERNWEPFYPYGNERNQRIYQLIKDAGLTPFTVYIPHPWPAGYDENGKPKRSGWDAASLEPITEWGEIQYGQIVLLAYRTKEMIETSPRSGFVQVGNEPAAGHPGGNPKEVRGRWSISTSVIWEFIQEFTRFGYRKQVAPAYSMQDEEGDTPVIERNSATVALEGLEYHYKALHHRYYAPYTANEAAYADRWIKALADRLLILDPESQSKWFISEAYIASGDHPGDRAECWREIVKRLKAGAAPKNVSHVCLYRWHPVGGPDNRDWQIPEGDVLMKKIEPTDYRYWIGDAYGRAKCKRCGKFRMIGAYWCDTKTVLCNECSLTPDVALNYSLRSSSQEAGA